MARAFDGLDPRARDRLPEALRQRGELLVALPVQHQHRALQLGEPVPIRGLGTLPERAQRPGERVGLVLQPPLTQRRLVESGLLGRKSQRGYYDYRAGASTPEPLRDATLGQHVLDRVLAMLINEAVDALYLRVASASDIELAMTKGVNYPKGLLAWCDQIGASTVHARLAALREEYGEDRYRSSPLLRRLAKTNARILS